MRRRALLTALGAALPAGLAGCAQLRFDGEEPPEGDESTASGETTDGTDSTPTAVPGSVTIVEERLARSDTGTPEELVSVVGTARNDGETALTDLTAIARFTDGDGESLGTASADLNELAPGREWEFSLVHSGSGEEARAVEDYGLRIETE